MTGGGKNFDLSQTDQALRNSSDSLAMQAFGISNRYPRPPARKAVLAQGPGETSAIQNGVERLAPGGRAKRPPLRDVVTIRQRHSRLGQIALRNSDDYRTNEANFWDGRSTAHHR